MSESRRRDETADVAREYRGRGRLRRRVGPRASKHELEVQMEPVAPERRQGGDELGEVAIGGFSFPVQNVDGASQMEAPTPTRGAPATLQQIPAAALLLAAPIGRRSRPGTACDVAGAGRLLRQPS